MAARCLHEVNAITRLVLASGIPGATWLSTPMMTRAIAVACTLAAVDAGARQIQGTLNGLGSLRYGNLTR